MKVEKDPREVANDKNCHNAQECYGHVVLLEKNKHGLSGNVGIQIESMNQRLKCAFSIVLNVELSRYWLVISL